METTRPALQLGIGLTEDRRHRQLFNGLGLQARLPLLGPAEVQGEVAREIFLAGDSLAGLEPATTFNLLREARHLLTPGGTLQIPASAWSNESHDLAAAAWLCGFDKEATPDGDQFVLTKPRRNDGARPLVSILIPAYKPDYLAESLRSALSQSYCNCEIVICDDSCGDEVAAVVAAVMEQSGHQVDPRQIRYIRNPRNLGGQANYLKCYSEARGAYIKFLNDDDLLAVDCVETMARCLSENPNVTLVTSYRQLVDEQGQLLPDQVCNRPLAQHDVLLEGRYLATRLLAEKINRIGEPTTVMFRKQDMIDNSPHLFSYNGTVARRNGDTYIWAALLSRGDCAYLSKPLSQFRLHAAQVQRDPAFVADARAVWFELADDAQATGLVHHSFNRDPAPYRLLGCGEAAEPGGFPDTDPEVLSLMDQNDFAGAVCWLRSRLHRYPAQVRLRSDLGSVLWAWGKHEAALAETLLALRSDPDQTTLLNLGDMLRAIGHVEQNEQMEQEWGDLAWAEWTPR